MLARNRRQIAQPAAPPPAFQPYAQQTKLSLAAALVQMEMEKPMLRMTLQLFPVRMLTLVLKLMTMMMMLALKLVLKLMMMTLMLALKLALTLALTLVASCQSSLALQAMRPAQMGSTLSERPQGPVQPGRTTSAPELQLGGSACPFLPMRHATCGLAPLAEPLPQTRAAPPPC